MNHTIVYIHGQGGSPEEAEHYNPLFPEHTVLGFDYRSETPWDAEKEFEEYFRLVYEKYGPVILIANSIGAYFAMNADISSFISKAYFISPVTDMEKLIRGMMRMEGVTEERLQREGEIRTASGTVLSWEYLRWVTDHPLKWDVPSSVLYGSLDQLTDMETIRSFAQKHNAHLTVMEGGEHWFHTEAQMKFLDEWLLEDMRKDHD